MREVYHGVKSSKTLANAEEDDGCPSFAPAYVGRKRNFSNAFPIPHVDVTGVLIPSLCHRRPHSQRPPGGDYSSRAV
jgi:hypothetical protein